MKQTIKCLFAAFAVMLVSVVSFAQVTTSSLGGRIVDAKGEPVVGVAVMAIHEESGTVYGAITNAEGRYAINGMRSGGPYKVEISCLGYRPLTYTDVNLQLAENFSLNGALEEDAQMLGEAMVVAAPASKFAAEKTGAATNITSAQITSLPTVSRSITDLTRLSPYGGNGMTFGGQDGRTANFTVDGANFNNNFGLNDGLPGGGNPISLDAIEEAQIVISPFDVRQTNFIGGGVNAITKSGTNTFKGSAYVYHTNENMRGNQAAGVELSDARIIDRSTTYGATLGGPIIKNKLFFFVNAEYTSSPGTAVSWRARKNDEEASTEKNLSWTTVEDMEKVQAHAMDKYGYDTGSFTDFPADMSTVRVLARLDWNINDKNKLAVRYNYTNNNRWSAPNGSSMDGGTRSAYNRTSLYSMAFANSMYSQNNLVHSASLDLNTRISDDLSNQLLVTFSKLDDVRGSNSDEFPFIDIHDGTNSNTQYMALGYELFTHNNAVHNTVANIKDDLTYYVGNHKITMGLNYEYQMADNAYMRNGTGYYRYRSVDDFISGATPEVVCLTYGYDGETNPAARVQFHKAGLYAQDEWNVNESFKLTYGLRFDGLFFDNGDLMTNNAILAETYYDVNGKERKIDTGKWPGANLTVSPRVGFSWDILKDRSLTLRGGTGLFSGRLPLVFFTNMPTNSGMVQYQAQLGPSTKYDKLPAAVKDKYKDMSAVMAEFKGGLVTQNGKATIKALQDKLISMGFPSAVSPEDGTLPSSISAVDRKFKMPQVWKTSVALDYKFPTAFPFSITAEGIFNKTVNGVMISDWSIRPINGFARLNGADNRPMFPEDFRAGTKAFVLENTHRGYGYSANVTMNMRPIDGLNLMAAYTYQMSKEITDMPGSNAESAFTYVPTAYGPNNIGLHNAANVTPHRVVASASYSDKANNHFSLIYEAWKGGYKYSYMLTNDMNADGYAYDALYIPTDAQVGKIDTKVEGATKGEFRFVSHDDAQRFMAYVHNDKYLSSHQGQYAEAFSVYNPWVHRLDFSYKHDFKIKAGNQMNTLQLSLDVKNLLNLFNSNWGVSKYMNPKLNSGRILKFEHVDAEGYPVFSAPEAVSGKTEIFMRNPAIGQCWYASVGIKYMFN